MQLYVLDRAKNTLATTASFYNDKHHKELTAGASIFEFTIDKSDSAAQYMTTGNYLVFLDDRGRAWSFTILSYDETQTTKTVAAEDVSIELLNKAMDVWNTDQTYPFSYYFNLVTKDTPWTLGVNQLTDLSRKLVYTGRDTGLGRLLSVLKGFDNAECQFNIKVAQNKPVEFTVDVYKSIGTVQDNIQIVYNNELNDIKKTESRAQFVTALAGVGGLVENQATTDPGLEKHIDFADIDYKDDNFVSPKGDKFLRAVTANRTFNPGTTTYIEDFYDYDTQSAQELLNRTLTQLKERSEPQYTYDADVKVIDPTLDIGDTVTIIDHDYNPALYLQARVATLDKSYTDPTQGAITFCNYRVLNSTLSDQLRAMQNIIDQMPTSSSVKLINSNIVTLITQNEDLKKQVVLALKSADGKNVNYYGPDQPIQPNVGDIWFKQNGDKQVMMIYRDGQWHELVSDMTGEEIKSKVDEAFANDEALQKRVEDNDTKIADNIAKTDAAVSTANQAVSAAGFANDAADQAKTAAANAQADAANALGQASTAIANASTAINAATDAQAKTNTLVTKVDDIAGTIETLATTETVNKLTGTVSSAQALAQLAADGLAIKADKTTVDTLKGSVDKNTANIEANATSISAKVTASDVTGMLGNYATQSWSEGQISAAKNEITASVETVNQRVNNMSVGGVNLLLDTEFNNLPQYWTARAGVVTGTFNGHNIIYYDGTKFVYDFADVLQQPIYNPSADNRTLPNQWYTLSFYVKGTGEMTSYVYPNFVDTSAGSYIDGANLGYANFDGDCNWDLTDNWVRHVYTFKSKSSFPDGEVQNVLFRAFKGNTFYITMPQLEAGTLVTDYSQAPEDMATTDWTKAQLDIKDGKISAAVTSLKSDITNATADMATQTWTQGRLDLTASGFKTQISNAEDGLTKQYTQLQQTLNGVQTTANNAVTQSQYTQLANQFTTTIANVGNGGTNLLYDGGFESGKLNGLPAFYSDTVGNTPLPRGKYAAYLYATPAAVNDDKVWYWSLPKPIVIKANQYYVISYDYSAAGSATTASDFALDNAGNVIFGIMMEHTAHDMSDQSVWKRYKKIFRLSTDTTITTLRFGWVANSLSDGWKVIDNVQIEDGSIAHPYSPSQNDLATSSQFTQLQNDINLRVKTGDFSSAVLNINDMISARVTNDDFHGAMLSMSDKIDLQVYNAKNGNLLRNSEFITDKYWTQTGNHSFWPFEPKKSSSGVPSMLIIATGAGAKTGGQLTTEFKADGLTKYDKVTLSFYAQGTAGTQLTFTLNGTTLDTYAVTLTTTRTYYTLTLVYDTGNKLSIFADRADNTIYVESLMLVKGATAMPWEPSGDNILTRIYMDDSDVLIQGKHIHLDGETKIDDAIIKSAMIDTVSANKLTAGTIDASNINVIHINGQNITANSITADKLAANAILVGLNSLGSVIQINPASLDFYKGGQRSMSLQKDGMHIIDYLNGEDVGLIHINRIDGHDNVNGLEFDLNKSGDYMAWGQRSDDTSLYDVKMGWFSSYGASQSNFARGVNIMDDLTIDQHYTAYLTKIGTNYDEHRYIEFSNTNVGNIPGVLIGSTSGHGILIGDDAIYLVFSGGVYNMWDVIHSIGTGRKW